MSTSIVVTPSTGTPAASTVAGRPLYVPVPSQRSSHTGSTAVSEPPSQDAIEQLRRRLREQS
jgi:hypothetical protein